MSKELLINLRGGLGNQLFCYFAGQYFSEISKIPIRFLYYSDSNPHDIEKSSISSFELSSNLVNAKSWKFRYKAIKLVASRLFRREPKLIRFKRKKLDVSNLIFSDIYSEQGFGFDEENETFTHWVSRTNTNKLYLRGNFQDFSYYDRCPNKQLKMKNPSSWYHKHISEAKTMKPIMMHIRLGNYLDHGNTLGVLSKSFYESALNKAQQQFPNSPIWIFSNNITQAKRLLNIDSKTEFYFIENTSHHDPAESLLLMGMGCAFIASNSTFSLWAAKIAFELEHIFIPYPFYKIHTFNESNLMAPWKRIAANWLGANEILELRNLHQITTEI